jgi:SpoVK/Ycf46/Vps4 family AAA+-type ATPase
MRGNNSLKGILETYIPRPTLGHPFKMHIEPGIYILRSPLEESDFPRPTKSLLESDEVYVFRNAAIDELRKEIQDFWSMGESFERMGFLHKRGLLVAGPPGSGKSTLLRQEAQNLVNAGHVVFFSKSPWVLSESIENFRRMEKRRPVTVFIEDIDEVAKGYGLHDLLEMLDGAESTNRVMFIGTTNNPESLPAKLKRPGRFDRKLQIDNPGESLRKEYIERKFKGLEIPLDEMAKKTEGFSFGDLRELVISTTAYKSDLDETIDRIRSEQKETPDKDTMDCPEF